MDAVVARASIRPSPPSPPEPGVTPGGAAPCPRCWLAAPVSWSRGYWQRGASVQVFGPESIAHRLVEVKARKSSRLGIHKIRNKMRRAAANTRQWVPRCRSCSPPIRQSKLQTRFPLCKGLHIAYGARAAPSGSDGLADWPRMPAVPTARRPFQFQWLQCPRYVPTCIRKKPKPKPKPLKPGPRNPPPGPGPLSA
jgi:hypothetical protein